MKNFVLLLILGLFISTHSIGQESKTTIEVIKKNGHEMAKALEEGDVEKYGSFFTENAFFKISNHEPLTGRQSIIETHRQMGKDGVKLSIEPEEVKELGEYVYELGKYELHTSSGEQMDHGYYSTLWKKEDGKWKIYRDVISSSVAMK